ncbi:MAG: aspartate carbamoyltransferase, partial [Gammaproteobacteria bacterium]
GAVSYYEQVTTFGKTYITRNIVLLINIAVLAVIYLMPSESVLVVTAWMLLATTVLLSAVVSRALFYVLVVPTTMPGAFFWKNKGFEQHARETGLAEMPQVGVIPDLH